MQAEVADAFVENAEATDEHQKQAAELSRNCAGVVTFQGETELHIGVEVKLCGSDLLESDGDDEPVSVWRRI